MAMTIGSIGSIGSLGQTAQAKGSGNAAAPGFGEMMKDAVSEVNDLQGKADTLAQKVSTGDVQDIHQAMLALNKANSAFGLTVQVRNKAVEAYQEIMRMQV
jgi:flagellar hook-basal body complex protein FliE